MPRQSTATYLEEMAHEPPARREARLRVSERLNTVHWRWKQRAQERAAAMRAPDARVEHHEGVTCLWPDPSPEVAETATFLRRFMSDPTFWDHYGRALEAPPGRHARGRRWAKLRRGHVSLWVELLVRGKLTPACVAQGDEAVGFKALSEKSYKRLLKARSRPEAPLYLLDGGDLKPGVWTRPHAVSGPPKDQEIGRWFEMTREGYLGLPAVDPPSPFIHLHGSALLHPPFVRSFITLRDDILTRLQPLLEEPTTRENAAVLRDDVQYRWWPLRSLHQYISQDVALEWWLARTPAARSRLLLPVSPPPITRATVRQIIAIHRTPQRPPRLSADGIALLLLRGTGSLGHFSDAAKVAKARLAVAQACLDNLPSLSPSLRTALRIEAASACALLAKKKQAGAWRDAAAKSLARHPNDYLAGLLAQVEGGIPVHIYWMSLGTAAASDILAYPD